MYEILAWREFKNQNYRLLPPLTFLYFLCPSFFLVGSLINARLVLNFWLIFLVNFCGDKFFFWGWLCMRGPIDMFIVFGFVVPSVWNSYCVYEHKLTKHSPLHVNVYLRWGSTLETGELKVKKLKYIQFQSDNLICPSNVVDHPGWETYAENPSKVSHDNIVVMTKRGSQIWREQIFRGKVG